MVFAMILFSCKSSNNNNNDGLSSFNSDSIAKHISVVASDEFMGRKPFTEGETKTIHYLQQSFMQMGLEPGNGTSYFQEVPMVNITATADSFATCYTKTDSFSLQSPGDYVAWTDKTNSSQSFNKDELVFAGYGVVAPEYNWNDYAGIDVRGKIVLVLVNDPGFNAGDTGLFKGRAMTWYGRWPYKFAEAARQGAKGCFIIHSDNAAGYPFSVPQAVWNTSRLRLDEKDTTEKLCDMIGWIRKDAVLQIFKNAGKDTALLAQADKPGFKAAALGVRISTSLQVQTTYNKSHNVIAKITGSKYPDETIFYTAHWDHLGIGKADEKSDSIYNGAVDNGSGIAGLLEIARAFKSLPTTPERTIVFLSVTAEEQGLYGSEYYARHPVYPLEKTVADFNMDMLNWIGETNDIIVNGQGQNNLEDLLEDELKKVKRVMVFDPKPETGSYYRSDHFNFAKAGVPSMDLKCGTDLKNGGKEKGIANTSGYTKNVYHHPSDNYHSSLPVDGMLADMKLLFAVGKRLAFERSWPQWKTGSEFKLLRDKTAAQRQ
ncbi:MAG: M20/M25/M40 family metallo-hydrolase [Bacteroidetes bacterium]|nr:M20/M25/M40 family metallo-hydrolase [Bacteroidota bacterium]